MQPIVTRKEAIEKGLKRFFPGTPCKHGHVSEWYTHPNGRGGHCCECSKESCKRNSVGRTFPSRANNYRSKKYQEKREAAAGRPKPTCCDYCGQPEIPGQNHTRLCWDHCHETGRFRNWLCYSCNISWGHFQEDTARVMRFALAVQSTYGNPALQHTAHPSVLSAALDGRYLPAHRCAGPLRPPQIA